MLEPVSPGKAHALDCALLGGALTITNDPDRNIPDEPLRTYHQLAPPNSIRPNTSGDHADSSITDLVGVATGSSLCDPSRQGALRTAPARKVRGRPQERGRGIRARDFAESREPRESAAVWQVETLRRDPLSFVQYTERPMSSAAPGYYFTSAPGTD